MIKQCLWAGVIVAMCSAAYAEPIRTALTKENRLPRLYELEGGLEFSYFDRDGGDITTAMPYLRYTLFRDFAANIAIPYHRVDPDVGKREEGFGDLSVGFEYVPYKDLFGYPWIMPYANVFFDTGNERKGLGSGSTEYLLGVAVGTTVSRNFHFVADTRVLILDDEDNIPSLAGSIVWDLDSAFSLIAEMEIARVKQRDVFGEKDDSHPILFTLGMSYQATRRLSYAVHGGTATNSDLDGFFRGRVAYRF